jgi:hypothetical protein
MRGYGLLCVGTLLLFGGLLSGCSAADGKWPSLMTDQERAAGKLATPATPAAPATNTPALSALPGAPPVIPMGETPQAPAAVPVLPASLSPAVSRLEQEGRAFEFTLERLSQNRQTLAAARLAATGKAAGSPERLALQKATRQQTQLMGALDDIRQSLQMVAGQLAVAGQSSTDVASTDVAEPMAWTGKLLTQVSAAREDKAPAPTLASVADGVQKLLAVYSRTDAAWVSQSEKLKASTAAVKRGDPERISWNQAQIDLTRVSQNAKSLEDVQEKLAQQAGDLAILSAGKADIAGPFQQIGAALVRIDRRLAENEALVAAARQTLERA